MNCIHDFLDIVCNEIKCPQTREEIRQELYEHILEERNYNIEKGIEKEQAELIAIKNMGNPETIGKEFNKIYRKKLDWKLFTIEIVLVLINVLLITTMAKKMDENIPYTIRNIAYITVGTIISILCYLMDYRKIQKASLRYRNTRNDMYHN